MPHCARAGFETIVSIPIRLHERLMGDVDLFFHAQHDVTDDVAAFQLADQPAPGKFGVFYQKKLPTKNEKELNWIADTKAKLGGATDKELIRKRFEMMR
jgi:2-oxoglutarate ferredoxin oxidoreductase subunit beta